MGPIEIEVGSIWPFHHMYEDPRRIAATKPAMTNARVRCRGTLNPSEAILIGSSRVALQGKSE